MPKTIKLVIDGRDASLDRVGAAVYISNLLREMATSVPKDWEMSVIVQKDSRLEIGSGVKVFPIAPSAADGWLRKLIWYTRLPRVLRHLGADIYFGTPLLLPWSSKLPCATVCTVHDTASIKANSTVGSFSKNLTQKYMAKRYLKAALAIICISNFSKREFTALFGEWFERKSHVIYHGVPNELGIELGDADTVEKRVVKYILTVGTVYPKKNIARLISAFERIDDPELYLYIAGAISQNSEQIISAASRSTKSTQIKFLGSVDNVELTTLYKNAFVFAFPSLHEGFGIPVLEAFQSGVPVVCSGNTSLPEIAGRDAAILFDPLDVTHIVDCLNRVLHDEPLRQKLIASGRERVRHFSWSKSAAEHWKIFRAVNSVTQKV